MPDKTWEQYKSSIPTEPIKIEQPKVQKSWESYKTTKTIDTLATTPKANVGELIEKFDLFSRFKKFFGGTGKEYGEMKEQVGEVLPYLSPAIKAEKYVGKLLPERWAESKNIFKKSIGTSVMKYGKLGYLTAPFQWMMDVPIGLVEETGRKFNYKKAENLREMYEAGQDFPNKTQVTQTLNYGQMKAQSPEAGEKAKDQIRRGIYSP